MIPLHKPMVFPIQESEDKNVTRALYWYSWVQAVIQLGWISNRSGRSRSDQMLPIHERGRK